MLRSTPSLRRGGVHSLSVYRLSPSSSYLVLGCSPIDMTERSVADTPAQASSVGWCGTLNNWNEEDVVSFRAFGEQHCSYWIFQREVGESGTPHLQAYVCLERKGRLSYLRNRLTERWHWEVRRGSHKQAKEYCEKEDSRVAGTEPESGGVEPQQGARTDIKEFVAAVVRGATDRQLLEEYPVQFMLHFGKLQRLRGTVRPKGSYRLPEVYIYYGPTGTGKSKAVFEACGEDDWWKAIPGQGRWFDGYNGQDIAWFDDFRGETGYSLLLNICDGYGTEVEVKSSSVWFHPKKIFFTSNCEPYKWYSWNEKELYAPFERRIKKLVEFKEDGTKVYHIDK